MKNKNRLRRLTIVFIVIVSIGLLIGGTLTWREYVIKIHENREFTAASKLIEESKFAGALEIIRENKRSAAGENLKDWTDLEIIVLEKSRNVPRLLYLFEQAPVNFNAHEGASLLVARSFIHTRNLEKYNRLRKKWRERETLKSSWFALDVDALLMQGKRDEALKLINTRSFKGAEDANRLIRLSLMKASDDLNESWNLLNRAFNLDPRNSDVRSFRAQILENIGKKSLARVEYVAAHLSDPDNLFIRDQLADFYLRNKKYVLALKTWTEGLSPPSLPFIWLKTLFWNKVARPVQFDWNQTEPPFGDSQPLVAYLLNLPEDAYWDDQIFQQIPEARRFLKERQETFWLKLINALKKGEESSAMEMLKKNQFKQQSWHPVLENNLHRVLTYRKWGVMTGLRRNFPTKETNARLQHQLFKQLDLLSKNNSGKSSAQKIPDELERFFKSKEAFAGVFLAAGWLEASLNLKTLDVIPADFPDWISYGFTQAIRYNRGNRVALDFASKQKAFPALNLLIAELLIADGNAAEGIKKLTVLAKEDSDVGFRAAWLQSTASLDQGNTGQAKQVVIGNPRLKDSVTGKEMLAKIALLEGKIDEADRMYKGLEKESVEAKAYLARRAFAQKDWATARRLTEELMLLLPDKMQLRANLEAINKAEGNHE